MSNIQTVSRSFTIDISQKVYQWEIINPHISQVGIGLQDLVYKAPYYLVTGPSSIIYKSTDLITWSHYALGNTTHVDTIEFNNLRGSQTAYSMESTTSGVLLVGSNNNHIYTTDPSLASNWAALSIPNGFAPNSDITATASNGNIVVAGGESETGEICVSTDSGANWANYITGLLPHAGSNMIRAGVYADGKFVFVAQDGYDPGNGQYSVRPVVIVSANNGIGWIVYPIDLFDADVPQSITYGAGKWIVGGSYGYYYSTNLINWTYVLWQSSSTTPAIPNTNDYSTGAIGYGNGIFYTVLVYYTPTPPYAVAYYILTSTNGLNWVQESVDGTLLYPNKSIEAKYLNGQHLMITNSVLLRRKVVV